MSRYGLLLMVAFWLIPASVSGQIVKRGQAGFRFLENPVSAEAVGRGGVGVTMLRNASALFWNPAGIGWIESGANAGMHYSLGIADINQASVAAAAKAGNLGVFGASLTYMDYGKLNGTRRSNDEDGYEETGTFQPQAYAVGLAYGRSMSDRFTFGVQIKMARQDLGAAWISPFEDGGAAEPREKGYAISTPALDVGASYDFQAYGLTFGAAVQNISQEIRYEEEQFALPFGVRFSMTVDPLSLAQLAQADHRLLLAVETSKARDFQSKVQFGGEYGYLNTFFVRAGYMGGYSERGLTLGTGVRRGGVQFDYAFQQFGVFGNIHLLSLSLSVGN